MINWETKHQRWNRRRNRLRRCIPSRGEVLGSSWCWTYRSSALPSDFWGVYFYYHFQIFQFAETWHKWGHSAVDRTHEPLNFSGAPSARIHFNNKVTQEHGAGVPNTIAVVFFRLRRAIAGNLINMSRAEGAPRKKMGFTRVKRFKTANNHVLQGAKDFYNHNNCFELHLIIESITHDFTSLDSGVLQEGGGQNLWNSTDILM